MNTKTAFPKMPEMKLEVSESVRDSSDDESQGQEDKEIVNLISQVFIYSIFFRFQKLIFLLYICSYVVLQVH